MFQNAGRVYGVKFSAHLYYMLLPAAMRIPIEISSLLGFLARLLVPPHGQGRSNLLGGISGSIVIKTFISQRAPTHSSVVAFSVENKTGNHKRRESLGKHRVG